MLPETMEMARCWFLVAELWLAGDALQHPLALLKHGLLAWPCESVFVYPVQSRLILPCWCIAVVPLCALLPTCGTLLVSCFQLPL